MNRKKGKAAVPVSDSAFLANRDAVRVSAVFLAKAEDAVQVSVVPLATEDAVRVNNG